MTTFAEAIREAREKGAEASKAYKASKEPVDAVEGSDKLTFKAVKVDDQGVITLVAASTGTDKENDTVDKGALIGMAYDFCSAKDRVFRANHDESHPIEAHLVESFVGAPMLKSGKLLAPGSDVPADDPIVGVNTEKGNETHWFVSVKPNDEATLEAAKAGKLVGASWGGMALKADDTAEAA